MGSVNDVGVPGQPLNTPPLTEWQQAVRAALNGSDVPVDTRLAAVLGTLTPAAGWADYGTSAGGMHVTRQGALVTVNALLKRTSDLALVVGTGVTVAVVPAGLRPAASTFGATFYQLTGTSAPLVGRLVTATDGTIQLFPSAAGTLTTTGLLAVTVTYRGA